MNLLEGFEGYLQYLENKNINVHESNLINLYLGYLRFLFAYEIVRQSIREGSIVLDVGCSAGYGIHHIADRFSTVVGVDLERSALAYALNNQIGENIDFIQADAISLPFDSEVFDAVISFHVIEHIRPYKVLTFLKEVKRVMKRNGLFICSTPNKKLRLLPFQKPWNPEHKKEYSGREFERMLNKVFDEVKIGGVTGTKKVVEMERARVKQNPAIVYFLSPIYRLAGRILPLSVISTLRTTAKRVIGSSTRERSEPELENFLDEYSIDDFQLKSGYSEGCIDFLAICKKLP